VILSTGYLQLKKELELMGKATLKSLAVGLALAAVLLLMNTGLARADIALSLVSVTPVGADFSYTYSVLLTPGSVLHPAGGGVNSGVAPSNSYVTLYDVQGLVAGSETYGGALGVAGNSARTEQGLGIKPVTETPVPADDAGITNITTYWTGPDVAAPGMAGIDLGTFSYVSHNPLGAGLLAYTGATQKFDGFPALVANNTSQVAGPGGPVTPPIPEPGTLALLAVGLPIVGGFYYRRRNK
jgi:hypothetical protein